MPVTFTRFAFVSRSRRHTPVMALCLLFVMSCTSDVQTSRDNSSRAKGIAASDGGIETITHTDESTQSRVAEVQYDRGSLAVGQTIAVSSTYQTDPEEVAEDFGISSDNTVTTTDIAVVVTSNVDKNLDNPMTIALDLPSSGTGLVGLIWDNRKYFVVYTVKDSETGKWHRGIKKDSELAVKNSQVVFQTRYLGRYEIFESKKELKSTRTSVNVATQDFSTPPVAIKKVSPIIAKSGETVDIYGRYFTRKTQVLVGGKSVKSSFVQRGKLSFTVPAEPEGMTTIMVTEAKSKATYEFLLKPKSATKPFIDAPDSAVCSGIAYVDASGKPQTGKKNCGPADCKAEGDIGCVATEAFPAVDKNDVPYDNMKPELRFFGENGRMNIPPEATACANEGQVGCLVTGNHISLEKGTIEAHMIRKGVTIPATLSGTGQPITGNFPSVANPLEASSGSWKPLENGKFKEALTAPKDTIYKFWDKNGTAHTFRAEGTLVPAAIAEGVKIHGVRGDVPNEYKPLCSASKTSGCYIRGDYVAVAKSALKPANIRNGATIGGVTGAYPSQQYPLDDKGTSAQELNDGNFEQAMASNQPYVFYNSRGEQLFTKVEPNLKAEYLSKEATVFGTAGILEPIDTNTYKAENLREGTTFGPIKGAIRVTCRSQGTHSTFNYTGDYGSGDFDIYDTIQDGLTPKTNPWENEDQLVCNQHAWENVTSGDCSSITEKCVFRNKHTGKLWSAYRSGPVSYTTAVNHCARHSDIKFPGDWQVPSIHDLMRAYVYGINHIELGGVKFFKSGYHWSNSQPYGVDPNSTWDRRRMDARTGLTDKNHQDNSGGYVLCIK